MKRVLYISHSPHLGGAERVLLNLLRHADTAVHDRVVCFPVGQGAGKSLLMASTSLEVIEAPYTTDLQMVASQRGIEHCHNQGQVFLNLIRESAPDVVVVNTSVIPTAVFAAKQLGIPVVLHCHGRVSVALFPQLELMPFRLLDQLQMTLADGIIVPSRSVAKSLQGLGACERRICVIPNGTKCHDISPHPIRSDSCEFVMLCTVAENKGCDVFIRAASIVAKSRPNAKFTIYGSGSPAMVASLRDLAVSLGLGGRLELRPHSVAVDSILAQSRAVVVASRIESFSMVTIEAMAHGRAIVASRCGGPEEIIRYGIDGLLFDVGDHVALASQLDWLVACPNIAEGFGAAGAERVRSMFDIRQMAQRHDKFLADSLQFAETNRLPRDVVDFAIEGALRLSGR